MENMKMNEWIKLNKEANEAHAQEVKKILDRKFDLEQYEEDFEIYMEELEQELEEVEEVQEGNNTNMRLNNMEKRLVVALNKVLEGYKVTINNEYEFEENKTQTITVKTQKAVKEVLKRVNYMGAAYKERIERLNKFKEMYKSGELTHAQYLWEVRYLR